MSEISEIGESGNARPLLLHVVNRFAIGGLENGVVNLINRLPQYRHMVIALTEVDRDFAARIQSPEVKFISLRKAPGHTIKLFPRLLALFRALRPSIVHTRNLGTLEVQVAAWAAGVPVRIHGEHGWDVGDFDGSNRTNRWTRKILRPFVTHYIALSQQLADYLQQRVGVPAARITRICNGVDVARFAPKVANAADGTMAAPEGWPFSADDLVFGTVGRMQTVKNQILLARAFIALKKRLGEAGRNVRLALVGDGPQAELVRTEIEAAGLLQDTWLPGARNDVPQLLREFDVYVLPSLAEGISNTILEAMASGLPVIATRVGGNAELVDQGVTGQLIQSDDIEAMTDALQRYFANPQQRIEQAQAARHAALQGFSLDIMSSRYDSLYQESLRRCRK